MRACATGWQCAAAGANKLDVRFVGWDFHKVTPGCLSSALHFLCSPVLSCPPSSSPLLAFSRRTCARAQECKGMKYENIHKLMGIFADDVSHECCARIGRGGEGGGKAG